MSADPGARFLIERGALQRTAIGPDPDAPAARPLAAGEARVLVEHFALTANNITYASFGQAMKYWQFFPAADPAWGCLPVWGFATVIESLAEGVEPGRRLYGFLPAGTHLVVQPGRVNAAGFVDTAAHRQELAAVYNHYSFCDTTPDWQARTEGLQAVLRPLFTTSFLIDDFLAANADFGAQQVLMSSASSKTAFGTAFCLARRIAGASRPKVVGLTSAANLAVGESLGCYDNTLAYGDLSSLDPQVPSVYVDFAGNAKLRREVHEHFADSLRYSCSVGGTHWQALGSGAQLPGPRPVLFFAPAQIKKRAGPPPDGWGAGGLQQRLGAAWAAWMECVDRPDSDWVRIVSRPGAAAMAAAYQALLAGQIDAREGLMTSLRGENGAQVGAEQGR